MSAFVTVALDGQPAEVRVDCWDGRRGPEAAVYLGGDVQLVATNANPATLRAAAQALLDLAEWRENAPTTKAVAA